MKANPVLFLDIDGVLLSGEELWASHDNRYLPEAKMFWLNYVCLATGCDVVVSSTWRMHEVTVPRLRAGGFNGHFHKHWATPRRAAGEGHPRAGRGFEIQQWLEAHPKVKRYAILDDDCDMLPEQRPFFIQTRFVTGLMREHAMALCQILNGHAERAPSSWPEILMDWEPVARAA